MARPSTGGHVRKFPRHSTSYRLISVTVDGVRRQRFEHRLVMEAVLGRPLLDSEVVHHKDEDGLNNAPGNLELMTQSEHVREHLFLGPKKWALDVAIEMRENGSTIQAIADHFAVNYVSIYEGFTRRGISTKDRRHGTTKWDFDAAKQMHAEGVSMREIARRVGVAAPSVRKAFVKYGVIHSSPPSPKGMEALVNG